METVAYFLSLVGYSSWLHQKFLILILDLPKRLCLMDNKKSETLQEKHISNSKKTWNLFLQTAVCIFVLDSIE